MVKARVSVIIRDIAQNIFRCISNVSCVSGGIFRRRSATHSYDVTEHNIHVPLFKGACSVASFALAYNDVACLHERTRSVSFQD